MNWPQNDYWFVPLVGVDAAEQARNLDAARQLSLSLLYWLQTEAPHPDEGDRQEDLFTAQIPQKAQTFG